MARSRSVCNPTSPEGCWIRYQLDVRNITLETVAKKACRHITLVSKVIRGERKSEKVEAALADILGYPTFKHLWAAAFINAERKAV